MTSHTSTRRSLVFVVLTITGLVPTLAEGQDPNPFDKGLAAYRQNQLEDARVLFEATTEAEPDNGDARAYLAAVLRRLDRYAEAEEHARAVLQRSPCHSFAHTVLGDIYAPQNAASEYANADSTLAHMLAAVDCDANFGDAWLAIVLEAMRRDERALEEKALRRLYESGFLTGPTLANSRWVLTTLPDSAVLVTNGDLDTYPAWALQLVETLRPDVAVVNLSLLGLPWYLRVIHDRYGLPLPGYDPDFLPWSSRIIAGWRRMSGDGQLDRPLHAAITVALSSVEGPGSTWQLAGPFWRLVAEEGATSVDTGAVRAALEQVRAADLAGPATSPNDHSPIRIAAGISYPLLAIYVAVQYGYALLESGEHSQAERVAELIDGFAVAAPVPPDWQSYLEDFRKAVRKRPESSRGF